MLDNSLRCSLVLIRKKSLRKKFPTHRKWMICSLNWKNLLDMMPATIILSLSNTILWKSRSNTQIRSMETSSTSGCSNLSLKPTLHRVFTVCSVADLQKDNTIQLHCISRPCYWTFVLSARDISTLLLTNQFTKDYTLPKPSDHKTISWTVSVNGLFSNGPPNRRLGLLKIPRTNMNMIKMNKIILILMESFLSLKFSWIVKTKWLRMLI